MKALTLISVVCMGCSGRPLPNMESAPMDLSSPVVMDLLPGRLPVVLVRFPGASEAATEGVPILVDTGSEMTILSWSSAKQLGLEVLPYAGASDIRGAAGRRVPLTHYAAIHTLELGALRVREFHVPVIESHAFDSNEYVGLIGQDLLRKLTTIVDMEQRKLHLVPSTGEQEEISTYLSQAEISNGEWTALDIEYLPLPYMDMQANTLEANDGRRILIDTGAVSSSFPDDQCRAMGMEPSGESTHEGVDGTYEMTKYGSQELTLFGFTCTLDITGRVDTNGILGMDLFSQFVLILEGPAQRLWLHHRNVKPRK